VTSQTAADSVVDDLAAMLFALDTEALTTARMTRRITRAIGAWAIARGWSVRTEAHVAVAASATNRGQQGFVDVVIRRGGSVPDVAIEIDSADKPWSAVKLRHAAAAGMEAIWVRWGDDDWSGIYEDIYVIQLRIGRSPDHRSRAGQLFFWSARRG
jgi:2-methylaconitate cis-trans-isomerase PrpF